MSFRESYKIDFEDILTFFDLHDKLEKDAKINFIQIDIVYQDKKNNTYSHKFMIR